MARAVLATVGVSLWLTGCSDDADPRAQLLGRLDGLPAADRFAFAYTAAGTSVLDCALPNRSFRVEVDRANGTLVVRDAAGERVAASSGEAVFLSPTLFEPRLDGWLRADFPLDDGDAEELRRVLGVDLAGYVLAAGLPADGVQTAAALAEEAITVEELQPGRGQQTDWTGYGLAIAAGDDGAPADVSVWLEGDTVARITVLPAVEQPTDGDAATGWVLDFARVTEPLVVPDVASVDVTSLDVAALRGGPIRDCEIGPAGTGEESDGR